MNKRMFEMKKPTNVPAGGLLHPLVAVQDAFEQLGHQGFEVSVGGLTDHPVGVATEGPAGNGAHQGLLIAQALDEVGNELRQIRYHPLHTAWQKKEIEGKIIIFLFALSLSLALLTLSNGTQHEDAGLLDDPVGVEKQAFEEGEEMRKQLIPKHVGENVERRSRTLPWRRRRGLHRYLLTLVAGSDARR